MRNWIALLVLAAMPWPAMAAKNVSIQQLEQILFSGHGKSDEKVADRLSDLALTERVSSIRLAKWEKEYPGSHTREALVKLADEAAFLDPPEADVLRDPPPDLETQEKMLQLAVDYVKTTINRLPNFYATRETTHFEDSPSQHAGYAGIPGLAAGRSDSRPLHSTGTSSVTVTYRDGREVSQAQAETSHKEDRLPTGLTTSGEFGPILGVVLGDAIESQLTWARWEQGTDDPVAVFRYAVPQTASHYRVTVPDGAKAEQFDPAYHGEIAIDPATGSILWLSVVAEMAPPHEMMRTAILVEYAPVAIGERTYNCPVHGVAISRIPVSGAKERPGPAEDMWTQLNDIAFTHYHLFGSEARIVGAGAGSGPAPSGAPDATVPSAEPGASPGTPPSPQ